MTPLYSIVEFLNRIGIKTTSGPVPACCFLPGVRVLRGTLVYDAASLTWPGDLLHEAGHITVAPAALRETLNDGIEVPDSVSFASEAEATAWAYAAVRHLKLDPAVLFHPGGYNGASDGLIATFAAGVYPGAAGLAHAGMTHVGEHARRSGLPTYPEMCRWLRS
jgi:hypothetical protein